MAGTRARVRTIDLGYEQMLMLDDGPGTRVRVLYGATWLTEEGAAQDRVLVAGAQQVLRGSGTAFISGLAPSRVEVIDTGPHGRARLAARWARWLRRAFGRMRTRQQLGPMLCADPKV